MKEDKLDIELKRLHEKLPFLWGEHNFHVKYLTRDYGIYYKGFIIGLENEICKLVFIKESNSQVEPIIKRVAMKSAMFTPPGYSYSISDGWYPLTGIIYWLSGVEYESVKDIDKDLENFSQYLRLHIEKVLDLFRYPNEFDRRLEYYRDLNKENQITVEKIREERARLHALGQDSSLEAAIASLRGGKK